MSYKGIVFDKDGTLLDFNQTWLPIYQVAAFELANDDVQLAQELLECHGFDQAANRFVGGSLLAAGNNREIAGAWAEHLSKINDEIKLEALYARLSQIFHEQAALHSTPVNGLQPTLHKLKQLGLKLGVATSDSYQGIHHTLHSFEVLHNFEFLCGYDSGHGVKPEPGMVIAFCEAMSLMPAEIIVVGDNRHDIEMGRNAQAGLCVGVLTGTSTRDELEVLADIVFDDISALVSLIDR